MGDQLSGGCRAIHGNCDPSETLNSEAGSAGHGPAIRGAQLIADPGLGGHNAVSIIPTNFP
jgi:hypothetical protein